MNVLVIGATGGVGRELVAGCLAKGWQVNVAVRNSQKLGALAEQCTVFSGELNESLLLDSLAGVEAVLSGLGPVKGNPDFSISALYALLLRAMKAQGVRRLVAVTGAGVKDDKDAPSISRTIIRGLMKLVAAKVLQDSEQAYGLIQNSGLDWTIARVPILVDEGGIQGELTGDYQPSGPTKMNRKAIAQWMVNEATAAQFVTEAPILKVKEHKQ